MKTSEVLNKAADLIEERGWTQGSDGWNNAYQELCLEGGIMAALGLEDVITNLAVTALYVCDAYRAVTAYLELNPQPAIAPIKDTLWGWNDDRGRTATEVIEVLRAAAVIEAAKEDARVEVSA